MLVLCRERIKILNFKTAHNVFTALYAREEKKVFYEANNSRNVKKILCIRCLVISPIYS